MNQKTAAIAIIGKPNAGKSTLFNYLMGYKLSIVTPKVQTTRSQLRGIITDDETQLIFLDTPGIFDPNKTLERAMVRAAWSSIIGADFVLFIIDSSNKKLDTKNKVICERLKQQNVTPIILLNKQDLVTEQDINNIKNELIDYWPDALFFVLSALSGQDCDKLLQFLRDHAPMGSWLYDKDELTTAPMRFLASEITREQLFLKLNQELPYGLTVETETWEEQEDRSIKINQVIFTERESHKMIILGKKGQMIKQIGQKAREEILASFGLKVHLFLFVKVRKNWEEDKFRHKYMGL